MIRDSPPLPPRPSSKKVQLKALEKSEKVLLSETVSKVLNSSIYKPPTLDGKLLLWLL